jgi:hypothetical protein
MRETTARQENDMSLIPELLMRRYRLTEEASAANDRLRQLLGWQEGTVSRLALALSLHQGTPPPSVTAPRRGKDHRGQALFRYHEDPLLLPCLVALVLDQHGGTAGADEIHELLLAHIHRGLALLEAVYREAGTPGDFLVELARRAGTGTEGPASRSWAAGAGMPGRVWPARALVGRRADGSPIEVTLNDTRRHTNPHTAIVGMTGSGKTQLAMQIARDVLAPGSRAGMLFFDFAKGDVAGNADFVAATGATVYRLPHDVMPISPFTLPDYSSETIKQAAEDKREMLSSLFQLGPKQHGRLARAIREAYAATRSNRVPAPDFSVLWGALERLDAEGKTPVDTLTETLRRLDLQSDRFWRAGSATPPLTALHEQRWIVDLHEYRHFDLLTAFVLIEQLAREMRALPDSAVDPETGLRELRCLVVLDEAHRYLKFRNHFLEDLVRESRSKGFAVMVLSQSPGDFEGTGFNYAEQMEFAFLLKSKATSTTAVASLLGVDTALARRVIGHLGRLAPLEAVARGIVDGEGVPEPFRIVPFFEGQVRQPDGEIEKKEELA